MKNIPDRRFANIGDDVKLGKNVAIFEFTNLYGCEIGDESRIGAFVEITTGAVIGKRVRVQSHASICSGVIIEDDAFIGHNVVFINDRYPTAKKSREKTWKLEGIHVKKGATVGSGSTILCGVTIGEYSMVGAGSVVTRDVPDLTVVAGNPAKVIRKLAKPL